MKAALLIPIFQPRERVLPFLKKFHAEDFDALLVVDDGSGKDYANTFEAIASQTPFEVVSYPTNKGKGYALRFGMKKLQEKIPDLDYVVTADGDGQHAYEDVLRVKENAFTSQNALVIGSRDFDQMIHKSQVGRKWATFYFHLATGQSVGDTQSGLRAIPRRFFDLADICYGDRYEYEMNFLLAVARQSKIQETVIQTIYFDGRNDDTHFRLFYDSLRISGASLLYLLFSFLFYGLFLGSYGALLKWAFPDALTNSLSNLAALGIAYGSTAILDYICLEFPTFHHRRGYGHSFWKFFGLALISFGLAYGFAEWWKLGWPHLVGIAAILQIPLGIAHYFTNHYWVFVQKAKKC